MQIAAVAGKVITLEFDATNARWSEYLRFKVQIDLTKPLKAGIFLPIKDKHHAWVQFKFEKLGDFYYKCGRIGHDRTLCNEKETSRIESLEGDNVPVFGPWLRTDSSLSNCFKVAKLRAQKGYGRNSQATDVLMPTEPAVVPEPPPTAQPPTLPPVEIDQHGFQDPIALPDIVQPPVPP